ncbi:Putative phosphatase [Corynebacterium provencense]|uniref:Phosphatase n=2 Tax=Corynebacterium provencense TaxID=1737425 RepID=A0A2Z3YW11_9CORY|nr:Putative phosphatase [Corynebacterium provencense]MCI1256992.1 Cof-type HAD-IIB family hydrolase [Corynebacterium provencense]
MHSRTMDTGTGGSLTVTPPAVPWRPRLIATDLDRTLLTSGGGISARTRAALDAAADAGIRVVPATARNPVGLRHLQPVLGFDGWALCSNGAFGVHLTTRQLLFADEIPAAVLTQIISAVDRHVDGVRYAVVRDAGETFVPSEGYADLASFVDHRRDPATMTGVPHRELAASPAVKLVLRHATLSAAELYGTVRQLSDAGELDGSGFVVTLSGAPFVEVMATGVSKAGGLSRLCRHFGVDRTEVLAFGDGLNDIEMLSWAGRGVAVANALDPVKDAADGITASNDDDGVARVIESVLG